MPLLETLESDFVALRTTEPKHFGVDWVMLWLSLLPFLVALGYRGYINRGQTWGTPDENVYVTYAKKWRIGSVYATFINTFLAKPKLEIPPTRYGFFLACRIVVRILRADDPYRAVTWVAAVSGAVAAWVAFQITHDIPSSLLVASSPLSLLLSRRALQDTFAALAVLLGIYAVQMQNPWFLGASVALALASREALVFYMPALLLAWVLRTGHWLVGPLAVGAGSLGALAGFYAVGGRRLGAIFHRLRELTDYVQRVQSGMSHRVLVDLVLMSPVTTLAAVYACSRAPLWLVSFLGLALVTHAFVTPKNVRFLLVVDVGLRMLCAYLPGHWAWVILGVGSVADFYLYRAFGKSKDPVTYELVLKSGMFIPPEVAVK